MPHTIATGSPTARLLHALTPYGLNADDLSAVAFVLASRAYRGYDVRRLPSAVRVRALALMGDSRIDHIERLCRRQPMLGWALSAHDPLNDADDRRIALAAARRLLRGKEPRERRLDRWRISQRTAPGRPVARRRGAGRPRGVSTRSSARSGDSGSDEPGEPPPVSPLCSTRGAW